MPLAATAFGIVLLKSWREELVGGEFDVLKHLAGIVRGRYALFARNAEVVCRNEHLYPSFELNDGEKSEGDENFSVSAGGDSAAENFAYALRKVDFRLAAVAVAGVGEPCVKYNGRNGLNNRSRGVGGSSAVLKCIFGAENFYVPFAAVENDFLGKERDSRDGVRRGNGGVVSGKIHKEIESHNYGVKAAVKGNGFNFEENVKYFDVLRFDAESAVDFFLVAGGKIYRKVF